MGGKGGLLRPRQPLAHIRHFLLPLRRKAQLEKAGIQGVQQADADLHQIKFFQQQRVGVVIAVALVQFGRLEAAQAECVLAKVGSAIAWIFAPLGWTRAGNGWKMAVAAVSGLIAKENVVATFGQLFGFAEVAEDGSEIWKSLSLVMTPVAAYGFLVFNLLCAPCFAAMGAIKREMNNVKWFWFAIGYQCILAYIVSLCIYQIGTLITVGTFGVGTVVAFLLIIGFIYLLFRPYKESNTLNFDAKKTVSAK